MDVVERACRICVDVIAFFFKKILFGFRENVRVRRREFDVYYFIMQVKKSLYSSEGRIVEKNDNTPVTVADFGVQALVSLGNFTIF